MISNPAIRIVLVLGLVAAAQGPANADVHEGTPMTDPTPSPAPSPAPTGLMCELLAMPEKALINDPTPRLGWIVNSREKGVRQAAYQILVSRTPAALGEDRGDVWDSGRVRSSRCADVPYKGQPLRPRSAYCWKVRTWDSTGRVSAYSAVQSFRTGTLSDKHVTARYPLEKHEVAPVRLVKTGAGRTFVDFGKAAYGTVKLTLTSPSAGRRVEVHLGEVPAGDHAVNRKPGASHRYRKMLLSLEQGRHTYTVVIPPDKRNTGRAAIKMPKKVGEVMPFRYCELVGLPGELDRSMVRQVVVTYPFDDEASHFRSSSKVLNDVWDLCKYSMEATSFCGVYVDGDRERIPYEADAYINQLGHYCVDREFTLARYSHEYLMTHPTWPTEWIMHSVLMAWADYVHTGNADSLGRYYDDLSAKTLIALAGEDGLISTRTGRVTDEVLRSIHFRGKLRDIVDWPHGSLGGVNQQHGETDGYELTDINTVVNAFHCRALVLMGRIAKAVGRSDDAGRWSRAAARVKRAFNARLIDRDRGVYVDGVGSRHSSLHANMMPLAFELVPARYVRTVTEFIKSRGMACSVYGAQYLLEALYRAGEADYALELMTARTDRSWAHMIYDVGSTITMEAWDDKYKPNQDWNHAWGAAPANVIPRLLMGVEPLEPAFRRIRIRPQPSGLRWARLTLPTIRGPVQVGFKQRPGASFQLSVTVPANTTADVYLPRVAGDETVFLLDNVEQRPTVSGRFLCVEGVGSGGHVFEARAPR